MIGAALAHWEKETCLKFEKYDANKHGGFERMQKNNLQLVQFTAIQDGYVSFCSIKFALLLSESMIKRFIFVLYLLFTNIRNYSPIITVL